MPTSLSDAFERLVSDCENRYEQQHPESHVRVQVGSATCENAAGARDVADEFRKHIEASGRDDVDLRRTGCTGNCGCEPVVGVFVPGEMPVKYQAVDREAVHRIFTSHIQGGEPIQEMMLAGTAVSTQYQVLLCSGERCGCNLDWDPKEVLRKQLRKQDVDPDGVVVAAANCFGLCSVEQSGRAVHVLVMPANVMYRVSTEDEMAELVRHQFAADEVAEGLVVDRAPVSQRFFDRYGDVAFLNRQSRVALRNAGVIDPERIEEYVHFDGFRALSQVLEENDPNSVISSVLHSNLRGRGGGGFPTGKKWQFTAAAEEQRRILICNADEGDPGAFMDRDMLESDPFSVIEGMLIGGFAIGASEGYVYIRAEYPLAIRRLENAIENAREHGLLGERILGTEFTFDIEIRLGAGAFVCGEETALIHSIEGRRGQPRVRPPYPSELGLWGYPTAINNVETLANVPAILLYGPEWFRRIGAGRSGGTKVFALAGKVAQTGLVEVPMGTSLRDVVEGIGGGTSSGKPVKAVQTGGPAGGCIPESMLDTDIDFDSLQQLGSIMGSGGMIVLDEEDCMVDVAKFFLQFTQDESCGKCTPCREGTRRMLEILERITGGQGAPEDVANLERLAKLVHKSSLCGLGRAAPNPVLSTLRHFRHEYDAHVKERTCPAKKCSALIHYEIDPEKCVGCTLCAKKCPVQCIRGERRKPHEIDQTRCIKCGRCFEVCRFDAVNRE